jgi:hypothetical protein
VTPFTEHFPRSEFQRVSDRALTETEQEYAAQLAQRLELIRHALGDAPIVLTSFVRLDSDTQHREGTAIDARRPAFVSWQRLVETVQQLANAAGLRWGQFIIYPHEDPRRSHFHLSLPTGTARQAVLVRVDSGAYVPLTGALLAELPDGVTAPAPAFNVAFFVGGFVAAAAAFQALGNRRA